MKKFMCFMLSLVILCAMFTVAVNAQSAEIKFAVGDDTLIINGQPVTVEKPYIVGEGVTLVPIRVITEAFGAEVLWDGNTKNVTLVYPDVNISLQIGNPVAEINGRAETLLATPELTNGYTMVPLRFISENFGAEVSYEAETGYITVVKSESTDEEGTTIEGAIESKYVGDSYYNWSMETPSDMIMETRYFDGTYTCFAYDDNNYIDIWVYAKEDDYNFEKSFADTKASLKSYTLTVADKDTSKRDKSMHIQAKDKIDTIDIYEFETPEYIFNINGFFANENEKMKNEGLRILSTFSISYNKEDTYDLSNAKDGVRKFESEHLNISFDVPQNHLMISDEDAENNFVFASVDKNGKIDSEIKVMAFSKK